jgi:hypothetical protein
MTFPRDEIIHCKSYIPLCDHDYRIGDLDIPSGIVHVDLDSIPQFFNSIRFSKKRYIVVSSCSDWSVCYQQEYPPWHDIPNGSRLFIQPEHGYTGINIGPRAFPGKCDPRHRYSIKCDTFTAQTFDFIPDNIVKWYTTNLNINDSRFEGLPFGLNNVTLDNVAIDAVSNFVPCKPAINKIYVNFQFYTNERVELFQEAMRRPDVCWAEREIDFPTYLTRLNECVLTLCPQGNGLDCFRTVECLSVGGKPIVPNIPAYNCYGDLVFRLNHLSSIFDINVASILSNYSPPKDTHLLTLSYWKNKIEESRKLL